MPPRRKENGHQKSRYWLCPIHRSLAIDNQIWWDVTTQIFILFPPPNAAGRELRFIRRGVQTVTNLGLPRGWWMAWNTQYCVTKTLEVPQVFSHQPFSYDVIVSHKDYYGETWDNVSNFASLLYLKVRHDFSQRFYLRFRIRFRE